MQKRNNTNATSKLGTVLPPSEVELLWERILRKITEQGKWIKASEYKLWPGVQFPTDLPHWKYCMIEEYISGVSEAEAEKMRAPN